MTLNDANQRRTADRTITEVSKNLRVYEPLEEHVQMHPSSPKRRRMLTSFVVGWTAGTIGFVLLFLR